MAVGQEIKEEKQEKEKPDNKFNPEKLERILSSMETKNGELKHLKNSYVHDYFLTLANDFYF